MTCSCQPSRRPLPRLARAVRRTVTTGLIWLGLGSIAGPRPAAEAALRQRYGDPTEGPCCTAALPADFRP